MYETCPVPLKGFVIEYLCEGIQSLAQRCDKLAHLDLSGCLYISNRAINAFIHNRQHQQQPLDLILGGMLFSICSRVFIFHLKRQPL